MKIKSKGFGWCVVNIGHPVSGTSYIVESTYSYTRSEAIKKFVSGTNSTWKYWRNKFNFRCARVICSFETLTMGKI